MRGVASIFPVEGVRIDACPGVWYSCPFTIPRVSRIVWEGSILTASTLGSGLDMCV